MNTDTSNPPQTPKSALSFDAEENVSAIEKKRVYSLDAQQLPDNESTFADIREFNTLKKRSCDERRTSSGTYSKNKKAQEVEEDVGENEPKTSTDMSSSRRLSLKNRVIVSSGPLSRAFPVVLVLLLLITLFIIIPLLSFFNYGRKFTPKEDPLRDIDYYDILFYQQAENSSVKNQPLVPSNFKIDPDTPEDKKVYRSSKGKDWKLVFSDEFNVDGSRKICDGNLLLKLEDVSSEPNLNYTSGMINSWNKLCFQGGYLEANVSFPSPGDATGYWPAIWTLGNLGRVGFGSTNDGLWPYTYNSCDLGVLVNQTNRYLSWLPGQRLNACVCSGDHPSPGIGRGAPEIDLFEGTVINSQFPVLSMSYQAAPFDFHMDYNKSMLTVYDEGEKVPGKTHINPYRGGNMQQAISAGHYIDANVHGGKQYQTFGFEYKPGPDGYIIWFADRKPVFRVNSGVVGPNKNSGVSQRVIPEEPMGEGNTNVIYFHY
ncbi:putative beta-glucan synthesis-associated protein [Smittium culicis]|uniref:Putative beta-glucan synthesis-associated protein n=1 Tax=Smittium culicis TaxID=133412 RepID=A0A1R1WZG5_9FUNG|nr:putative beta-glucan synthesis-associated protein [Smittium culicis]